VGEVFFEEDSISVVRSKLEDAKRLAPLLRQSDVKEVWDSHHHLPLEALEESLKHSIICLTVKIKDEPVAMFGICPEQILGSKATIWMLASDKLGTIKKRFVKNSRHFIDMFLDYYPHLSNFVSVENMPSLTWLRWLGAKFSPPVEYGMEGKLFQYFYFKKES